eukprot:5329165-Prymnesium_polylepis.1
MRRRGIELRANAHPFPFPRGAAPAASTTLSPLPVCTPPVYAACSVFTPSVHAAASPRAEGAAATARRTPLAARRDHRAAPARRPWSRRPLPPSPRLQPAVA